MVRRFSRVELRERARELRNEENPVEERLWAVLRDRRCQGWKFRRQHVLGPFIADFYCVERLRVVEIDGVMHQHPDARVHDAARDVWMAAHGIDVLRLSARAIRCDLDGVLAQLTAALDMGAADQSHGRHPGRWR